MFLIKQRGENGIDANRFTLAGSPCYEQVGHLGEVGNIYFVRYGAAQCDGEVHIGMLEFLGGQCSSHGYHFGVAVWYLNANRSLARHGGNDADTQRSQTEGYVVFQVFYLRDAHPRFGNDFIQRNRGADGSFDFRYFDIVVAQRIYNLIFVGFELMVVHRNLTRTIVAEQIEGGILVSRQIELGVVLPHLFYQLVSRAGFFFFNGGNGQCRCFQLVFGRWFIRSFFHDKVWRRIVFCWTRLRWADVLLKFVLLLRCFFTPVEAELHWVYPVLGLPCITLLIAQGVCIDG